jgi:hypothetical protein
MKGKYVSMLNDAICDEIAGVDYTYNEHDKEILKKMFAEINLQTGSEYNYLAEVAELAMRGAGSIMAQYVDLFDSESIRCYLIPHIVSDGVRCSMEIVLQSYLRFRTSKEYISKAGEPSPAHIYVRYDNAFKSLKPKRLAAELYAIVKEPRDAYYLPLTVRMLSSWKIIDMEELLLAFLGGTSITAESVGLGADGCEEYYPSLDTIKRELRFTALAGLIHFNTERTFKAIESVIHDADEDIANAAKKTLKKLRF